MIVRENGRKINRRRRERQRGRNEKEKDRGRVQERRDIKSAIARK